MERIDRWVEPLVTRLAMPGPFLSLMAAYYLLVGFVSSALFTGASIDTAEQMMFTQDWALRYDDANPPLFTWLVKIAELVLGSGVAAVALVKFSCLWATHAFLFALGRTLRLDPGLTVLIGLSPLTLYYLAWDSTYTYSHSLLMTAACCASVWATARILERPGWARFAILGAIFCVGLLAKYNFGVFALGLLITIAIDPRVRRRQVWQRIAVSLALALPALALLVAESGQLANAANGRLAIQRDADTLASAAALLPTALEAIWQFLLPMLPLYAVAFWPALLRRPDRPIPSITKTIALALAITAAMLIVGLLAVHATTVRTPYVFMFVLIPVALLLRLAGYARLQRSIRIATLLPLALMAVVPVGLAVKAEVEPESCRRCFLAFDYTALADGLRQNGFERGTIVGRLDDQGRIGGLRPHFPDSRLISLRYPNFIPTGDHEHGQCVLLWYDREGNGSAESALTQFVVQQLETSVPTDSEPVKLEMPLSEDRDTIVVWAQIWSASGGQCR